MPPIPRLRLALEHLEPRETPSATITESFNATSPPALPAGWGEWSNDGSDVFQTTPGQGVDGSGGVTSSAGSRTRGLAWYPQTASGDATVSASVKVDSLVPTFVFARGTGLGTLSPSYLAAVVKRGVAVELVEVRGDSQTVLASLSSPGAAYFSGGWVRVSLVPNGTTAGVQVTRGDTGQYLNTQGRWQAAPATAITATTTIAAAPGLAGVGRAAAVWGPVQLDDFNLVEPVAEVAAVEESFDTTAVGTTPGGWGVWASDANGFKVSTTRANSAPNGFTSSGGTQTTARAWADETMPADVDASAALYLDSLIPAQLFVRGSGLNTSSPTYYAVTLTRGLEAKLAKVVNGVETPLGSIKSTGYFSSQWLRVHLTAEGDRLRVTLYRADTQQWLSPDGSWSESPDFALEVRDGSITGGGKAGVGRKAVFSGAITFDDFAAEPADAQSGPVVTITPVTSPVSGEVTFRATVTGSASRIEFRLNNQLRAVESASPAEWTFDSTTVLNGSHTLSVRAFDAAGDFGSAELVFTTSNAGATPIPIPTIPRHYSHIRVAALAYSGNPMGEFEKKLLRESIDVVVPNPRYFATIEGTSPDTPQIVYSNVSNLYQGLLTDWLNYADRTGAKRELAFYHVTKATAFTGTSSSAQPVNWFWGTYQTSPTGAVTDVTSAARGGRNFNVAFGGAGQFTTVAHLDKFREMNITLAKQGMSGWVGVWEYVSAVDASGNPAQWKTLPLVLDGTAGLTRSGGITFDPPADWKTSVGMPGGSRLYSIRFRVTSGTAAQGAELKTLFGRDYVRANGGYSGTIPAFDGTADKDGDGYLTDAEYATRRAGYDARFYHESRLFYPYYGQMRFVTNPSSPALRAWAADYHDRLLAANPLADGVFLDNAHGKLPFAGISVVEPTTTYSTDSGALTAAVSRKIAPHWVMANTAGGTSEGDGISNGAASVIEEFLLRPMEANWSEVGDAANLVARRLAATSSPYVVLDTYPGGGSPLDPRTQVGALAYYYLVADPDRTMIMFFGGSNPSSSWYEHWTNAAAVNVGKPAGAMRVFAAGTDPANAALTYKVFARDYGNALVLYKPLSYATGKGEGTTGNATTTAHQLGGNYRPVNADGTLGPVVTQVNLRNGEGAVLVRA